MKMKFLWIGLVAFLLLILCIFIFGRIHEMNSISTTRRNKLRLRLHVPVVDTYMKLRYSLRMVFESTWSSEKQLSQRNEVLHMRKTMSIDLVNRDRFREVDLFTRKDDDSTSHHLMIYTLIIGEEMAYRHARFYEPVANHAYHETDFQDQQIDSIAREWRLFYLIKGKN